MFKVFYVPGECAVIVAQDRDEAYELVKEHKIPKEWIIEIVLDKPKLFLFDNVPPSY